MEILETAYLEVFNNMTVSPANVTAWMTSRILNGNHEIRSSGTEESSIFKVQFNPEKLQFSTGTAPKDNKRTSITPNDDGIVPQADVSDQSDAVTVRISLVFDRSIYKVASVKEEVDGFLAMVQNPYVRKVAFHWGNQYYKGVLKDMDAEYVHFNSAGTPTRANVNFSIQLL
jgi:hypothetical protein